MKFIEQLIFRFSPCVILCRVLGIPRFCKIAPTASDSLASAVPFLCSNCQCASPVSGMQQEGTKEGRRKGGLTFAESLKRTLLEGRVTACLPRQHVDSAPALC